MTTKGEGQRERLEDATLLALQMEERDHESEELSSHRQLGQTRKQISPGASKRNTALGTQANF